MATTHDALADTRNEHIKVWLNGELVPRERAAVSVFDSGFLVGDGVWEGIRLHDDVFVFLDEHLDRLFQGAAAIALDLGRSRAEFTEALYETVRANEMHTGVHTRLMVTRGIKKTPSQDPRLLVSGPTTVIIAEHKQANPETTRAGVRLFTSTVRRGSPDSLDPRLNCHSKLHEVVALAQAIEAGADEALMLDPAGFVATCNATNFFVVRGGEVWTSTGKYCMNGITRGKILATARAAGLTAREHDFSLFDVYDADEAFVTGTFGGVTPVTSVDGRCIADGSEGPVTTQLRVLYKAAVLRDVARARDQSSPTQ